MRIAIIGASPQREKYANKAVRAFLLRGDEVVPIHPAHAEIEGLKTYADVTQIPGAIDVASFYVSPEIGLRVLAECAQKNIRAIILNPGAESDELLQRAQELGIETKVACSIVLTGFSPRDL